MTQYSRRASLSPRPILRSSGIRQAISELLAVFRVWAQRARSRRHLSDLPPHLLRDIGVTREEAEHEASKPFWL
ncbi:MAG: DUF1127 domain-containing protein [Pseudomonadota bacterium]